MVFMANQGVMGAPEVTPIGNDGRWRHGYAVDWRLAIKPCVDPFPPLRPLIRMIPGGLFNQ